MQSISGSSFSVHSRRLLEYRNILRPSSPISPSMESPESSREMTNVAKTSFDSSLAIILAALLCSVLCALGVSAVVRCRLRCRRWLLVSEPSLVVGMEGANTGIKKIDVKALPATVYQRGFSNTGMDCPICLAEFVEGEKVRILPECCHSFHADCIDAWLVSNPSCPSCRHSLLYVFLKKSAQPAAESAHSARMGMAQRNETVALHRLWIPSNQAGWDEEICTLLEDHEWGKTYFQAGITGMTGIIPGSLLMTGIGQHSTVAASILEKF